MKGQGHSLSLVKCHSDFKVQCLTLGLYTQMSDSGPHGPLVLQFGIPRWLLLLKIAQNMKVTISQ